ncbi:MAG: hypothetical protein NW207_02095 [Cytophagales bacterium]|nr:hypothetical protein [Cytophagales bacterium]
MKKIVIIFILLSSITLAQKINHEAYVQPHNGKPTLFVDGKPEYPLIYSLTGVVGCRWSFEEVAAWNIKQFKKSGIRIFNGELWPEDIYDYKNKRFNIDLIQKQIRGFSENDDNAYVILRVQTNVLDWNIANPDETTQYADSEAGLPVEKGIHHPGNYDLDAAKYHSIASEKWKNFMADYFKRLLIILDSVPEGKSVIAIHIGGGIYGEWHNWGSLEHEPDTSMPMKKYYQNWLLKKYATLDKINAAHKTKHVDINKIRCPNLADRSAVSKGIFRDPQSQQFVIDYYDAYHDAISDAILHLAKTIKENSKKRILTGAFYGYYFALFGRNGTAGHLKTTKLLSSKYLDYLAGPQSYTDNSKPMGSSGQSRGIQDACRLNGKLYIDEHDHYSLLKGSGDNSKDSLIRIDKARITRCIFHPFTKGCGTWFYDFGPEMKTGWWDHVEIHKCIKRAKTIMDSIYTAPYSKPSDVLFVYDENVYFYTANSWKKDHITHTGVEWGTEDAYKAGAVFDQCYLSNLDKMNISQYKTIVFVNTFLLTPNQVQFIKNQIIGKTPAVVWNYMPGICNGTNLDIKNTEALTGLKFKYVSLTQKPEVRTSHPDFKEVMYNIWRPGDVLIPISEDVEVIAKFSENNYPAVVCKNYKNTQNKVWFCALPLQKTEIIQGIFKNAGVHLFTQTGNVVYAGNNILLYHTAKGGNDEVKLPTGKIIKFNFESISTTIFDYSTGTMLLNSAK